MSCHHLKHNNERSNGWMILKFELVIHDIHVNIFTKLQLHLTVELGDMGLQS
jgi:hypothetical protein